MFSLTSLYHVLNPKPWVALCDLATDELAVCGVHPGKFGTKKYWTDNGEDASIVNTVYAIDSCLREPVSVGQCRDIRGVME